MNLKKTIPVLVLLAIGLFLAGCVSSNNGTSPPGSTAITVVATDYKFSPSTIPVSAGQSIALTLQNNGAFPHTFTIASLNLDTGLVSPGQSATVTFTAPSPGSYQAICRVPGHADRGMVATLVVQ